MGGCEALTVLKYERVLMLFDFVCFCGDRPENIFLYLMNWYLLFFFFFFCISYDMATFTGKRLFAVLAA